MTLHVHELKYVIWNFNSHAHVERDAAQASTSAQQTDFNSHAHVERDEIFQEIGKRQVNFNSHAHVERDFFLFNLYPDVSTFQLTRSRGA